MRSEKVKLIYLFGAGRSGTTILSTVLNAHKEIKAVGELHQFYEYLSSSSECSCGSPLETCNFWNAIVHRLPYSQNQVDLALNETEGQEKHKKVLMATFRTPSSSYISYQKELLTAIYDEIEEKYILDSSKYLARYLWLKKMPLLDVKGIYMVRDVRGVVNSFKKNVQTSRKPLSAIFYYISVNVVAQLVCWFHKGALKIRYEDLMEKPNETTQKIFRHLGLETKLFDFNNEFFEMPHIIGGNRIKSKSKLKLSPDEKWKTEISKSKKIIYYILAFPIMTLNKYKVL